MHQRSTGLSVARALTGSLQYKAAEGLASVTIAGYECDLKLWIEYQGHLEVQGITSQYCVFLSSP
jgi:hypothetical protein